MACGPGRPAGWPAECPARGTEPAARTHVDVVLVGGQRGEHGRHAVAAQRVAQHGRHHRVAVRHVGAPAVGQRHDHLLQVVQRQVDVARLGQQVAVDARLVHALRPAGRPTRW